MDLKVLGQLIRTRRHALKLSQVRLGARVPCDPASLSRWERGLTPPQPRSLLALERILGPLDSGDTSRVTGPDEEPSRSQP